MFQRIISRRICLRIAGYAFSAPTVLFWNLGLSVAAWADSSVRLVPVVSELTAPVYVTHSGDGSGRLFILEQGGRIRIYQSGQLLPRPFLDIRSKVDSGGEKGLLGLAFHPNFSSNGRLFINYTTAEGGQLKTIVAEYGVSSSDPNRADPVEKVLLEFEQPFSNHNGGHLDFGPDGKLYIGTGDGGAADDPFGNGQNLNTLLGKILRIDVDQGSPFAVPPDNPFVNQANARPEIWAYGLRNPWRFSFDPATGSLFVGDVGQGSREEVDIVTRGGNYGWNRMEGSLCFPSLTGSCDQSGLVLPIAEYGRSEGVSIIGGYVYRGSGPAEQQGLYIFGDYGSGRIWALEERADEDWNRRELLDANFLISSFGVDESGEIHVVDHGGGSILRLEFLSRQFIAHVADGVSGDVALRTTFVLVNPSTDPVAGEVNLHASDGSPMQVRVDDQTVNQLLFSLAPHSSRTIVTGADSDPFVTGWAEIVSDGSMDVAILYTLLSASGEPLAEAGVDRSERGKEFVAHVSRRSAFELDTGVAVANPSATENADITLVFTDMNANSIASGALSLGPLQQTAGFLGQLASSLPADFEGTLTLRSTQEIMATLLRTKGGVQLSSIPITRVPVD